MTLCHLSIQAHGGGVIYHEGVYYWYGENKAGSTYTAYSLGCVIDFEASAILDLVTATCSTC